MAESIGISGIFQQFHTVGGVYFFFENLLKGFDQLLGEPERTNEFEITVFHGQVRSAEPHPLFEWRRVNDRFGRFATETALAMCPGRHLDVLLFLNYFRPPIVRAGRSVTVIHDLQYRHMPQYFSPLKQCWLNSCHRHALRSSDAVITISEAVRQDVLHHYGHKWEDRVFTIHNPVALDRFEKSTDQRFACGRPYILCAAIDRPQKNLFTLIRAFDRLKDKFPDHLLVLAGELRATRRSHRERSAEVQKNLPATVDLVTQLNLQDRVVVTGFISDADLGGLYRHTSLFVLPSIFEGFGMPAIEALAMGAPTLVSGLPVLREVTLQSANYLDDPEDAASMADAMSAILSAPESYRPSDELRETLRARFSPRNIAQQYLKLFTAKS